MRDAKNILENSKELLDKLPNLSESQISSLVAYHNQKYFRDADPEISDEAFDKLVETLRFINPDSPELEHIEESSSFREEIVHKQPMLSLEKCYDVQTFFKWAEKINGDFVVMPKIDGVACSIIYSPKGKLISAATRGDGKIGENITQNIKMIKDIPHHLHSHMLKDFVDKTTAIEIRGEVYLPLSRFNDEYSTIFANPRNLAAGALKHKEKEKSKAYGLSFFPYDIRGTKAATEKQKFEILAECNFSMMPWHIVKNNEKTSEVYFQLEKDRATFDYEIDGVVYRANEQSEQTRLGETAHHPRFAIAFKFHGESAQTKLERVEWSVSRSGIITPVAIVKPIFVSGANVSRASLHNLRIFNALELCEESLVEINRRGGVIPHVERVLMRRGAPIEIPKHCPSCHHATYIEDEFLYCSNKEKCVVATVARLVHFAHVIGIEGMGEKIVAKLHAAGFIKHYQDIYQLKIENILQIEGMGQLSATKLIEEINSKREIELQAFLRALGIDEVGANIAELIAANFHSLSKVRELSIEDLTPIFGIGERIAQSVVAGLEDYSEEIDEILLYVKIKDFTEALEVADKNSPIFGKSFVFTGKMAHMERKSAQELVKKMGGRAPGAMSD
ncbi:MAG: NAD-dependent DNA ligase LigA, partial [Myxococcales bacterium]|nr:NAD-dependent DNA ligase LigA [Myxococcales bacterium]